MANEIKDLNGFTSAIEYEYNAIRAAKVKDVAPLSEYFMLQIYRLLASEINEAEYINQWVKE